MFTGVVAGMGFAREHDLHRMLPVGEDPDGPAEIAEEQRCAFVGGEAAGKTDGEDIRREHVVVEADVIGVMPELLLPQPLACKLNKLAPQCGAQRPEILVGDFFRFQGCMPELGVTQFVDPLRTERIRPELRCCRCCPAGRMHAVGDRADRDLADRCSRIEILPHFLAYAAVQHTDAVCCATHLEGEHGHTERLSLISGFDAAVIHQVFDGQADGCRKAPEVALHKPAVEAVMSGGHGSVRGEHAMLAHERLGIRQ